MTAVRWALVVVLVITVQTSLVSDLTLFGARGDVVLLLAVAAGLVGGPESGAFVGFAGGLTFDLLLQSPFGLSALAYCLTGYVVGTFQGTVLRAAWWIPVLGALAGSAVGIVVFALVGETVGQDELISGDLIAIVAVVALFNAVLVLPAMRVARWAMADTSPLLSLR
ncbi:rod shape-determining protein MreD [soil metagenome]